MNETFNQYVESHPDGNAVIEIWRDPITGKFDYQIMRKGVRVVSGDMPYPTRADALDCAGRWLRTETESILFAWLFIVLVVTTAGFVIYVVAIGFGLLTAGG